MTGALASGGASPLGVAVAVALGIAAGYWLNAVIDRLPRQQPVWPWRPGCPACGRAFGGWQAWPLVGDLGRGGRCPACGSWAPARQLAVQSLGGLALGLVYLRYGLSAAAIHYAVFTLLLIPVALIDLEHQLIPHRLTLAGLATGLLLLTVGPIRPGSALIGLAVAFGGFLLLYLLAPGWMGGGDVMLAGLLGFYLGWPRVLVGIALGIVANGLGAAAALLLGLKRRRDYLPYGVLLALGGAVAALWGDQLLHWYLRR